MPKRSSLPILLILCAFPMLSTARQTKQSSDAPDELFKTVKSLDAALFDAYNRCDLEKFNKLLVDDLEFYHDQGGATYTSKEVVDGVKNNICGKVRRELVENSLEVYPIKNYGAVEIGVHRFYHPGHDDTEPVGEAKFVMLWQNKDGIWKLTRVFSFDHRAQKN